MSQDNDDAFDDDDADDPNRIPCPAALNGDRCAYERGHDCPHWTITKEGEQVWTEESEAMLALAVQLRRVADQLERLADLAALGTLKART